MSAVMSNVRCRRILSSDHTFDARPQTRGSSHQACTHGGRSQARWRDHLSAEDLMERGLQLTCTLVQCSTGRCSAERIENVMLATSVVETRIRQVVEDR